MPVTKAGDEMPKTPNITDGPVEPRAAPESRSDAEQDAGDEHDQRADQAEENGDAGALADRAEHRGGCR